MDEPKEPVNLRVIIGRAAEIPEVDDGEHFVFGGDPTPKPPLGPEEEAVMSGLHLNPNNL